MLSRVICSGLHGHPVVASATDAMRRGMLDELVHNGYHDQRTLLTGLGPIAVRQPRVDDHALREDSSAKAFISALLPAYARRAPSIDTVVPALYLNGISTGDFPAALAGIFGESVGNLSASTVTRLKSVWEQEYAQWSKQDVAVNDRCISGFNTY